MYRFDVVNNSWGYGDSEAAFSDAPNGINHWALFQGLHDAAMNGRNGLGTVLVKSAGNQRDVGLETNTSGFAASRFTLDVGAVASDGYAAFYSTPGATLHVVAPSSGAAQTLTSTDWGTAVSYTHLTLPTNREV